MGGRGDSWPQGLLGKWYQELHLLVTLVGCYLGHVVAWGGDVNLRSLQVSWPNKMDAKAAIPCSSLAKLSTPTVTQVLSGKVGLRTQTVINLQLYSFSLCFITSHWQKEKEPSRHVPTAVISTCPSIPGMFLNFSFLTYSRHLVCYLTHSINIRYEYLHSNNYYSSFSFLNYFSTPILTFIKENLSHLPPLLPVEDRDNLTRSFSGQPPLHFSISLSQHSPNHVFRGRFFYFPI